MISSSLWLMERRGYMPGEEKTASTGVPHSFTVRLTSSQLDKQLIHANDITLTKRWKSQLERRKHLRTIS